MSNIKDLDSIILPEGYKPSETEEYMCPMHLAYFKKKLLNWKQSLLLEGEDTIKNLVSETENVYSAAGDDVDKANDETFKHLELRIQDRAEKVIAKIDYALKKIQDGTFGYCEITDEPIGLKRLEAKPISTMTLEAQEEHEKEEKQYM